MTCPFTEVIGVIRLRQVEGLGIRIKFHLQDNMLPNGGKIESATLSDYFMHFLTFGLKIMFSSCPPPGMLQGWPSFVISLVYIGFMAALIR